MRHIKIYSLTHASNRAPGKWPPGSYLQTSEEFEIVGYGGSFQSVGRGGGLTGNKVDIAILDDLYKDAAEGNSPTVRESVWEWYTSAVKTRLHNGSQELIVFTRWHEEDLIGILEDKEGVRVLGFFFRDRPRLHRLV